MSVICIHPRLAGLTSHHFNEAQGFIEEFRRRATNFELLISVHAPATIVGELDAHPVVDDPTFRMDWSFEERSDRFLAMLHEHVDRRAGAGDCVLITVSTQLESHALVRWLAELPSGQKPWVVILFLSDRWNRSTKAERERQIAEFRALRGAISSISSRDAQRVIFFTVTEPLAAELTGLLGTAVRVVPLPLAYPDPQHHTAAKPSARPRVAVLGGLRAEKGSYLVPDIIRACQARFPVEFLVHLANNSLTPDELKKLASIADEPHVSVIDRPMTRPEYYSAVASADIGIFPYEVIPYRQRTSGVFAEMVAFGKPVAATRGTWLAEQIEAGRAAGTIFNDLEPESITEAIAQCISELEPLTRSARALSSKWRRTVSMPAFVDAMETTIAARAREERLAARRAQSRRPWHFFTRASAMAAHSHQVEFVLIVEQGRLEAQALLLVESLRTYGGRHAAAAVTAVSPRSSRRPGRDTVRELHRLGAEYLALEVAGACPVYPPSWRVHTLAELERRPGPEVIAQLDSDTVFLGDVGPLCCESPASARPVDVKGMGSSGPADPYEPYWESLCRLADVPLGTLPFVRATVDGTRVRATHNGGFVAAHRARGLFARADEIFRRSVDAGLRPHADTGLNVIAGAGEVGIAGSEWWGSAQAALSVAAASLGFEIGPLPAGVNVPMHSWDALRPKPEIVGHAHYHWLLADPVPDPNPMFDADVVGSEEIAAWLRRRAPLGSSGTNPKLVPLSA